MGYVVRKGRLDEKRRWNYAKPQPLSGPMIYVTCPRCGRYIRVGFIDDDGTVRSALSCAHSDCEFMEHDVKLIGYNPDGPFR